MKDERRGRRDQTPPHWPFTIEPAGLGTDVRRLLAENRTTRTRRETVRVGHAPTVYEATQRRMASVVGDFPATSSRDLPTQWFGPVNALCVELRDSVNGPVVPDPAAAREVDLTLNGMAVRAIDIPSIEHPPATTTEVARQGLDVFGPWDWEVRFDGSLLPAGDHPDVVVVRGRGWTTDTPLVIAEVGPYVAGRLQLLDAMGGS